MIKLLKPLYLLSAKSDYKSFIESLDNPREAQDKILQKIINNLNLSQYGKNFGEIKDKEDYRQKVPIINYDDIRDIILKQKEEAIPLLTPQLPKNYEYTSGSSSAPKPIPYTKEILKSFQRLFKIWSYDVLGKAPFSIDRGKFYFSISPILGKHQGLEDDREYLSGLTNLFLSPFWVGHQLKGLKDLNEYQLALTISMTYDSKLEVMSIWSPSLLIGVFEYIENHKERIISILNQGQFKVDGMDLSFTPHNLKSDSKIEEFFPSLKFISCWGSANAKLDFERIQKLLPNVYMQKKGLLATEAPLSVPLIDSEVPVPLIQDIFFEFQDGNGNIYSLEEVEVGKEYQIIFSHLGGLYRYSLGDTVIIERPYKKTPSFDFLGRAGIISDLCGEKLSDQELNKLFQNSPHEFVLFPNRDHYLAIGINESQIREIEETLCNSPHYQYARMAGQLKELKAIPHRQVKQDVLKFFNEQRKMKLGDIKIQRLYPKDSDHELKKFLLAGGQE